MDAAFIHDNLEIKFLILYIAARVSRPIPVEGMQELTLCDSGIDYFSFSQCLNDLVRTEHLTLSDDGLYAITPKGLRNSEICESSLPMSVRLLTDRNVAAYNQMLLRKEQVRAQVTPRENGTSATMWTSCCTWSLWPPPGTWLRAWPIGSKRTRSSSTPDLWTHCFPRNNSIPYLCESHADPSAWDFFA